MTTERSGLPILLPNDVDNAVLKSSQGEPFASAPSHLGCEQTCSPCCFLRIPDGCLGVSFSVEGLQERLDIANNDCITYTCQCFTQASCLRLTRGGAEGNPAGNIADGWCNTCQYHLLSFGCDPTFKTNGCTLDWGFRDCVFRCFNSDGDPVGDYWNLSLVICQSGIDAMNAAAIDDEATLDISGYCKMLFRYQSPAPFVATQAFFVTGSTGSGIDDSMNTSEQCGCFLWNTVTHQRVTEYGDNVINMKYLPGGSIVVNPMTGEIISIAATLKCVDGAFVGDVPLLDSTVDIVYPSNCAGACCSDRGACDMSTEAECCTSGGGSWDDETGTCTGSSSFFHEGLLKCCDPADPGSFSCNECGCSQSPAAAVVQFDGGLAEGLVMKLCCTGCVNQGDSSIFLTKLGSTANEANYHPDDTTGPISGACHYGPALLLGVGKANYTDNNTCTGTPHSTDQPLYFWLDFLISPTGYSWSLSNGNEADGSDRSGNVIANGFCDITNGCLACIGSCTADISTGSTIDWPTCGGCGPEEFNGHPYGWSDEFHPQLTINPPSPSP